MLPPGRPSFDAISFTRIPFGPDSLSRVRTRSLRGAAFFPVFFTFAVAADLAGDGFADGAAAAPFKAYRPGSSFFVSFFPVVLNQTETFVAGLPIFSATSLTLSPVAPAASRTARIFSFTEPDLPLRCVPRFLPLRAGFGPAPTRFATGLATPVRTCEISVSISATSLTSSSLRSVRLRMRRNDWLVMCDKSIRILSKHRG